MSGTYNQQTGWGRSERREARLQHQLQVQSEQIERVLSQHQLSAQIAGGTVRPRLISFDLNASLAQGWERLSRLTHELKSALNVPEVRLSREDGQLKLHITRPEAPPVALLDLLPMMPDLPPVTAVLGLDEVGRPVLLDFDNPDITHVLISGEQDAGKTTLLRSLAVSLAVKNKQSRLQLLVIDPETADSRRSYTVLEPLSFLPHMLAGISYRLDEAIEVLSFLHGEMEYRRQQRAKLPTIVLLVDKIVHLLEVGGESVAQPLQALLRYGAEAGIHCVLSTRRPDTAVITNQLRANLPVRLVGQMPDEETARTATGLLDSQAEYLLGQGDFLAVVGGEINHFQAAYIGDYDLHMCLDELHRNRPQPLLAKPLSVRPSLPDVADDEITELPDSAQSFHYDGWDISFTPPVNYYRRSRNSFVDVDADSE